MGTIQDLPEAHFHILLVLADGEKHGYHIMQEVESLTSGQTKLSPGTLYGAIQRLLGQGYIEEVRSSEPRRRYYAITADGRAAAEDEVERLRVLLQHARTNGLGVKRSNA